VAADIPAGLGYLAIGLAFATADAALVLNRDRAGKWWFDNSTRQVEEIVAARDRASRWTRWMYWGWGDPRWRDVQIRSRLAKEAQWIWIPAAFMLSIVAVALINSAVTEFRR
jgi:hypothetical protein